jgi:Mrp family chromosome partitioning ATPase
VQLRDIGTSLRRHWVIALVILLLTPIVAGVYLWNNRNPSAPPATYTTSTDVLIPAKDKDGNRPPGVPAVLLQGQVDLALSGRTRAAALQGSNLDPNGTEDVTFNAVLSEEEDILTLSVTAPRPEVAQGVLSQYVTAFSNGRTQSVLDDAVGRAESDTRTINTLARKLTDIQGQLAAAGVPMPAQVPDGVPLAAPEGTPNETILLLYQRNAILNEIQRRQSDFGFQTTLATIPSSFSQTVQRRTVGRIAPAPESNVVPALVILGVGLLLAVAVPVLIDRFDRSITDSRSAANSLRSRVLVSVPAIPRRVRQGYAPRGSSWDAAFRSLAATSISTDSLPKALMVSSPTGSIQDTVAANLARSLARLGVKVALIGTVPRQRWYTSTTPQELLPDQEEDYAYNGEDDGGDDGGDDDGDDDGGGTPPITSADSSVVAGEMPQVNGQHADEEEFDHPTFVDLLRDAQTGRLPTDFRDTLATVEHVPNLYVIPPGPEADVPLDGLPSLLDAFSRDGIDTVVIGGPAYLEDPNATIIAWSTRNMLWALEMGRVDSRDALLAADRLDIAGVAPFGIAVVKHHG